MLWFSRLSDPSEDWAVSGGSKEWPKSSSPEDGLHMTSHWSYRPPNRLPRNPNWFFALHFYMLGICICKYIIDIYNRSCKKARILINSNQIPYSSFLNMNTKENPSRWPEKRPQARKSWLRRPPSVQFVTCSLVLTRLIHDDSPTLAIEFMKSWNKHVMTEPLSL